MAPRNRIDPLDLDTLATDIADMLDKYVYPIPDEIGPDEIRAALPAFLNAMGLGLTGQPLGQHAGGPVRGDAAADSALVDALRTGEPNGDLTTHEPGSNDVCSHGRWHFGPCLRKTKHTCNPRRPGYPRPYGRLAPKGECPRCDELHNGAEPYPAPRWIAEYRRLRDVDAQRAEEIRDHFRQGGRHEQGGCGPVCTFGEW